MSLFLGSMSFLELPSISFFLHNICLLVSILMSFEDLGINMFCLLLPPCKNSRLSSFSQLEINIWVPFTENFYFYFI